MTTKETQVNGTDQQKVLGDSSLLTAAIKDRFLEQLPLQLEVYVSPDAAKNATVTELAPQVGDAFIYQLAMMIQGNVVVETANFPKTWWDAVKFRWTPSFLRRWVKADAVEVATKVTYNFFPGVGVH